MVGVGDEVDDEEADGWTICLMPEGRTDGLDGSVGKRRAGRKASLFPLRLMVAKVDGR